MSRAQKKKFDELVAGIELGGTKVVCGLGNRRGELLARQELPTRDPDRTLADVRAALEGFFRERGKCVALGIASFGPVRLDAGAADYGCIGPTPKTLWRGCNLPAFFRSWLDVPIALDTDVNGAALGEARWGAAMGCESVVYITVGTGIGGGIIVHGRPVRGLLHPEVGHMRLPRAKGDNFPGNCPHHGDCVEGLAAGSAIVERWGEQLDALAPGHQAYEYEAHYLSHLVVNLILTLVPERIVLGGGVMSNPALFPRIRDRVVESLNGFISIDMVESRIDELIVPPGLGADSGVLGAIAMAETTT